MSRGDHHQKSLSKFGELSDALDTEAKKITLKESRVYSPSKFGIFIIFQVLVTRSSEWTFPTLFFGIVFYPKKKKKTKTPRSCRRRSSGERSGSRRAA